MPISTGGHPPDTRGPDRSGWAVVIEPSGASYESWCGARIDVIAVPATWLPLYRGLELARPVRPVAA